MEEEKEEPSMEDLAPPAAGLAAATAEESRHATGHGEEEDELTAAGHRERKRSLPPSMLSGASSLSAACGAAPRAHAIARAGLTAGLVRPISPLPSPALLRARAVSPSCSGLAGGHGLAAPGAHPVAHAGLTVGLCPNLVIAVAAVAASARGLRGPPPITCTAGRS
ncbi:unnamed protein product [Urochloa humidicola]